MSTEFVSQTAASLDDWDATEFVAWGRKGGVAFEFGTMTNFERVRRLAELGETFVGLGSTLVPFTTAAELDQLVADGRVTFGDFPVTVAVGSGTLWRFTVED